MFEVPPDTSSNISNQFPSELLSSFSTLVLRYSIPGKETQLSSITNFSPTALALRLYLCTLINVFSRRCCVQECSRNVAWREADLWLSPCFLWGRGSARVCALRKWGHISIKTTWVVHRIKNREGRKNVDCYARSLWWLQLLSNNM